MATNDNRDLIGPGQMQVLPGGLGTLPLPFLKPNAIAQWILENGTKVSVAIDRNGALLVYAPGHRLVVIEQGADCIRLTAEPK